MAGRSDTREMAARLATALTKGQDATLLRWPEKSARFSHFPGQFGIVREKKRHPKMPFILLICLYTRSPCSERV